LSRYIWRTTNTLSETEGKLNEQLSMPGESNGESMSRLMVFCCIPILFLLLLFNPCEAQSGWFWQNPLPQGNTLLATFFTDTDNGTAVGYLGTIIHTTDGGTILHTTDGCFLL
jgi:hypothetical protein